MDFVLLYKYMCFLSLIFTTKAVKKLYVRFLHVLTMEQITWNVAGCKLFFFCFGEALEQKSAVFVATYACLCYMLFEVVITNKCFKIVSFRWTQIQPEGHRKIVKLCIIMKIFIRAGVACKNETGDGTLWTVLWQNWYQTNLSIKINIVKFHLRVLTITWPFRLKPEFTSSTLDFFPNVDLLNAKCFLTGN